MGTNRIGSMEIKKNIFLIAVAYKHLFKYKFQQLFIGKISVKQQKEFENNKSKLIKQYFYCALCSEHHT